MIFNKKCFKNFGEILKILNYHTFNVYYKGNDNG